MSWREQFWPAVCEHFGVEPTGEESRYITAVIIISSFFYAVPLPGHFFKMLLM